MADNPDGTPNTFTLAYGHKDLKQTEELVADVPDCPGSDLIVERQETLFVQKHKRVIRNVARHQEQEPNQRASLDELEPPIFHLQDDPVEQQSSEPLGDEACSEYRSRLQASSSQTFTQPPKKLLKILDSQTASEAQPESNLSDESVPVNDFQIKTIQPNFDEDEFNDDGDLTIDDYA